MAKQKIQTSGDDREKLIESAKSGIETATESLEKAGAEFKAASTAEEKAAAQTKIDAAGELIKRHEKALEALMNPKGADERNTGDDKSAERKRDFIVASPIKLDGRGYEEGDTISLDKPTFDQLYPLGVIAGQA